jgi:hypothetical protein
VIPQPLSADVEVEGLEPAELADGLTELPQHAFDCALEVLVADCQLLERARDSNAATTAGPSSAPHLHP